MIDPIVEKRFDYKGYPCVVMFMPWGCHRCGYVGFPKRKFRTDLISCHGGITYHERKLFGQDDKNTMWIGFDCAHAGDERDTDTGLKYFADDPEMLDHVKRLAELDKMYPTWGKVRSQEFVEEECRKIVEQLIELGDSLNKPGECLEILYFNK